MGPAVRKVDARLAVPAWCDSWGIMHFMNMSPVQARDMDFLADGFSRHDVVMGVAEERAREEAEYVALKLALCSCSA